MIWMDAEGLPAYAPRGRHLKFSQRQTGKWIAVLKPRDGCQTIWANDSGIRVEPRRRIEGRLACGTRRLGRINSHFVAVDVFSPDSLSGDGTLTDVVPVR
jgi:hypothetical protein